LDPRQASDAVAVGAIEGTIGANEPNGSAERIGGADQDCSDHARIIPQHLGAEMPGDRLSGQAMTANRVGKR
jgi:hypothetical protein